jgi:hypothetical protein
MDGTHLWEVFTKIVWPAVILYVGYLHKWISDLQRRQSTFETETSKQYATRQAVDHLESKLVTMLMRIDDKVDRILERK